MKRTKIVATIGPASDSEEILEELFLNGLNVTRLNFSHGTHEEHKEKIDTIKKVREKLNLPIAIMLDTKGPEIRLGDFENKEVILKEGNKFTLTSRDILGDETIVSQSYKNLADDVKVGDRILIDDGLVGLLVEEIIDGTDIITKVINGGAISNHKGVNVPYVDINLPAITEKDISDIKFGIENDIDFIAASFIRKNEDVFQIRKILEENFGSHIGIISKIENQEGVDNIEDILKASDGIMVARGDLGVEIDPEEIPMIQKRIIARCNKVGKPVITATQMLDSMMRNPRPTRAEVTDVANAILDGTDAIMLSGEAAVGKYPLESVKTMYKIANSIETSEEYREKFHISRFGKEITTTDAISKATCTTAEDLEASAIITATSSGSTSRSVAKYRPKAPIIAATYTDRVMRQLSLVWGVYPVKTVMTESTDQVIDSSIAVTIEEGYVKEGDLVVLTAGIPVGVVGTTNLLKVHTIGKVILKGTGIGKNSKSGKAVIGNTAEELDGIFEEGDILVSKFTDRDTVKYMEKASALLVEEGGLTSHAAILGLHLEIPTIVGADEATEKIKNGETITVDALSGLVYRGEARVL